MGLRPIQPTPEQAETFVQNLVIATAGAFVITAYTTINFAAKYNRAQKVSNQFTQFIKQCESTNNLEGLLHTAVDLSRAKQLNFFFRDSKQPIIVGGNRMFLQDKTIEILQKAGYKLNELPQNYTQLYDFVEKELQVQE